jgi:conjugative relaxase-like TrwC/TraI family protein
MLSTKVFKSSSNAKEYYSHADYYGAEAKGEWFGNGIKDFNVSGRFEAKASEKFQDILDGKMPDGKFLGRRIKTEGIEHTPGVDLTFSSPKSVSIQMHVLGGDEERTKLEIARMTALKSTLSYIESSGMVYVRKGAQGKIKEELSNLTFALFSHTTNRKLEPQDHVHCLLANVAKCTDGKYRTISIEDVLKNNKMLGQIFRNELALEVQKAGYSIITTKLSDGSSSFELRNISQDLIDAFSTRRKELVELFKYYDVKTKEGRDRIVINSRESKKTAAKDQLDEAWANVVKEVQAKIVEKSMPLGQETIIDGIRDLLDKTIYRSDVKKLNQAVEVLSSDAVARLSLEDITFNKSVFTKEELIKTSLKNSVGIHSIREIEQSISDLIKQGHIIKSNLQESSKNKLLTSHDLLQKEKAILKIAKQGLNKTNPIIKDIAFEARYSYFDQAYKATNQGAIDLNKQQKIAVRHILTSQDKITALQGLPGVGKSTVIDRVRLMSGHKTQLIGMAPTASAAQTLEKSANIKSQTLHSFIGKYRGYLEGRGTEQGLAKTQAEFKSKTIIVDEASLIGTRQMYDLLRLSEILKVRVVLVGDANQLAAVEAGQPFEQLLGRIRSVKLDLIIRQKDTSHIEAIKSVADNNILKSFEIHQENIMDGKQFINSAVKKYVSLSSKERNSTILISPSREHRDKINQKIIEQLSSDGTLKGPKFRIDTLKAVDMSQSDYGFARSYNNNMMVKFNKAYKASGIAKGDQLEIKGISEVSNALLFKKGIRNIRFQLKAGMNYTAKLEVFEKNQMDIQEGMCLRITKNNGVRNLVNSDIAKIEHLNIHNRTASLQLSDSSTRTLPLSELKHVDYGYCSTIHSSQGKTTDRLIAAICSHKKLNNQKAWIVAISRHKSDLHVYMQDKDQIQKQLISNRGIEKSALDITNNNKIRQTKTFTL